MDSLFVISVSKTETINGSIRNRDSNFYYMEVDIIKSPKKKEENRIAFEGGS